MVHGADTVACLATGNPRAWATGLALSRVRRSPRVVCGASELRHAEPSGPATPRSSRKPSRAARQHRCRRSHLGRRARSALEQRHPRRRRASRARCRDRRPAVRGVVALVGSEVCRHRRGMQRCCSHFRKNGHLLSRALTGKEPASVVPGGFDPRPARGPGAARKRAAPSRRASRFQSSPGPAGRVLLRPVSRRVKSGSTRVQSYQGSYGCIRSQPCGTTWREPRARKTIRLSATTPAVGAVRADRLNGVHSGSTRVRQLSDRKPDKHDERRSSQDDAGHTDRVDP